MPAINIANLTFPFLKDLHAFLDGIRTMPDHGEFQRLANSAPVSDILYAIITTRPKKRDELGGREVVGWTRRKNGPHWAFHAELADGSLLDLGVNNGDISEFVRFWPG